MGTISLGHHSLITGGTFTQVNNNHHVLQSSEDRLQAATAPAALHNSAERFDPPRCHPNTRVAVMDELIDWIKRRGAIGHKNMMWLSGPAGAGKSAIAQSLCEICFANKSLLAAFFFNRFDPSRNNPKRLVPTLVSQIYRMIPQHYQHRILESIRNDPLIFDQTPEAQLKALIVEPLQGLFEVDHFNNYDAPRLIVLDGLDECSTGAVQVNLLAALQAMLGQASIPFIILVASRPEHDIQTYFRSSRLESPIHRLDLDNSYIPAADISLFVREKLAEIRSSHPFKGRIPKNWPSDEVIQAIVSKSSGQFIYASVVVKYVTSIRHYPPDRLDEVLRLRPAKRNLPFAELDGLYSHIFSCVEDKSLVHQIIFVIMLFNASDLRGSAQHIEALCGLQLGECFSALCDLQSVLQLPLSSKDKVLFLHKSLPDYLKDPARSLDNHIDTSSLAAVLGLVSRCLRVISELGYDPLYGCFMAEHWDLLVTYTEQLQDDIMSFSLLDQCKSDRRASRQACVRNPIAFALLLLARLHSLRGTNYEYLYNHHLQQLQKFALEYSDDFNNDHQLHAYKKEMVVVLLLSERSAPGISPAVFDFLPPVEISSPYAVVPYGYIDIGNLLGEAALRCINSLVHDDRPEFVLFALKWLPDILDRSTLRQDLYEACLPAKMPVLSRSNWDNPSGFESHVQIAMEWYRQRFERKFKDQ